MHRIKDVGLLAVATLCIAGCSEADQQVAEAGSRAVSAPDLGQTFGEGELSDDMKAELEAMGMTIQETNSMRGYWIGIMIDPETGELRGGGPREFDIAMGGRAVGY